MKVGTAGSELDSRPRRWRRAIAISQRWYSPSTRPSHARARWVCLWPSGKARVNAARQLEAPQGSMRTDSSTAPILSSTVPMSWWSGGNSRGTPRKRAVRIVASPEPSGIVTGSQCMCMSAVRSSGWPVPGPRRATGRWLGGSTSTANTSRCTILSSFLTTAKSVVGDQDPVNVTLLKRPQMRSRGSCAQKDSQWSSVVPLPVGNNDAGSRDGTRARTHEV